jgi:hypothetical protein
MADSFRWFAIYLHFLAIIHPLKRMACQLKLYAKTGEPRWTRTNDPQLKRLLLYRLS